MTPTNTDDFSQFDRAYRMITQASSAVEGAVRDLAKARTVLSDALGERDSAWVLAASLVKRCLGTTVTAAGVRAVGRLGSLGNAHTLRPDDIALDGLTLTIRGWIDLSRLLGRPEPGWVVERNGEPGLLAVRMRDVPLASPA